jgi:hypothetical protein
MHIKEKNVLYPMIGQVLAEDRSDILKATPQLQQD